MYPYVCISNALSRDQPPMGLIGWLTSYHTLSNPWVLKGYHIEHCHLEWNQFSYKLLYFLYRQLIILINFMHLNFPITFDLKMLQTPFPGEGLEAWYCSTQRSLRILQEVTWRVKGTKDLEDLKKLLDLQGLQVNYRVIHRSMEDYINSYISFS